MHIFKRIKKEAKILSISLAAGLTLAAIIGAYTFVYAATTQREIASHVLRFHVLAHDNTPHEQALKNEIRDIVLAQLEEPIRNGAGLDDARTHILSQLTEITHAGQAHALALGFDHPITAEITHRFFPTVIYGDIVFPPGRYETLLITIGEGTGQNWWCLMFPPLCYIDMTASQTTRNLLEETIPPAGFALLTHQEQNTSVTVRFRVIEWWQNRSTSVVQQDLQMAGR